MHQKFVIRHKAFKIQYIVLYIKHLPFIKYAYPPSPPKMSAKKRGNLVYYIIIIEFNSFPETIIGAIFREDVYL